MQSIGQILKSYSKLTLKFILILTFKKEVKNKFVDKICMAKCW